MEFNGIVPNFGSEGHGNSGHLIDCQKAPWRYFTFTFSTIKTNVILPKMFLPVDLSSAAKFELERVTYNLKYTK